MRRLHNMSGISFCLRLERLACYEQIETIPNLYSFFLTFKPFRETLVDVFEHCDLDDNGYLSRDEFDLFQLKSGGDLCDDDAWQVMNGNCHRMPSLQG